MSHRLWRCVLGLLCALVLTGLAAADDTYWQHDPATPGDWFDPANWSVTVPTQNDDAFLANGGVAHIGSGTATALYLYLDGLPGSTIVQDTGTVAELDYPTIGRINYGAYQILGGDLTMIHVHMGGQSDGAGTAVFRQSGGSFWAGTMSLKTKAGGNVLFELTAGDARVGQLSVCENSSYRQTGGTMDTSGRLLLLGGGVVQVEGGDAFLDELKFVHDSPSTLFEQGSATVTIDTLRLADSPGTNGTYRLGENGSLTTRLALVGYSGAGSFFQTGGTHTVTESMTVRGRYELSDGLLDAALFTGSMAQTGGTSRYGYLQAGTYQLTGGTMQLTGPAMATTWDIASGAVTISALDVAWLDFASGTVSEGTNATVRGAANSVIIFAPDQDPDAMFSSFSTEGIRHTLGQTLVISAGSSFVGPEQFADHVRLAGSLVHAPGKTLSLQDGIELLAGGVADLGLGNGGALYVRDTASTVSGGTLKASTIVLQDNADALLVQTGGGVTASVGVGAGRYELHSGTLSGTRHSVGGIGGAMFLQTAGQNNVSTLEIGSRYINSYRGQFSLSGSGVLEVRWGTITNRPAEGPSRFIQTGGTSSFAEWLDVTSGAELQLDAGSLRAGQLKVTRTASAMVQTGGTALVADQLNIAEDASYALSGGDLTAGSTLVGYYAVGGPEYSGLFDQLGGVFATDELHVSPLARYLYAGGSSAVSGRILIAGELDFGGAEVTLDLGDGCSGDFSVGSILNAAHATIIAGVDSSLVFPSDFNPYTDLKSYQSQGLTHIAGGVLVIPEGVTFEGDGIFGDHVQCGGTIRPGSSGEFHLAGGVEVTGNGSIELGAGSLTVDDEVSGVSGGFLTAHAVYVGREGTGRFVQTSGVVTVAQTSMDPIGPWRLYLGRDAGTSGTYRLSDDGHLVADSVFVGRDGTGRFVQSGGIHNASSLHVDSADPGEGSVYELIGGQLNVSSTRVGNTSPVPDSTGRFVHSGGTHTADAVYVAGPAEAEGQYDLSGTGLLSARLLHVGTWRGSGHFIQNGGTVTVNQALTVGDTNGYAPDSHYELLSGSLSADTQTVARQFEQRGGTNTAAMLTITEAGRYEYTGGVLTLGSLTLDGTFDFKGAAVTLSSSGGLVDVVDGQLLNAQNASLDLGERCLLLVDPSQDMSSVFGVVRHAGLTLVRGTSLTIPLGREIVGAGRIDDPIDCQGILRATPGQGWTLTGGLVVGDQAVVELGSGTLTGEVTMSGDARLSVGTGALDGGLTMSGASRLDLGAGAADVSAGPSGITGGEITGGSLRVSCDAFTQTGGVVRSPTVVSGVYQLSAGEILADELAINARGGFVQTGGNVDTGSLWIPRKGGAWGSYEIQAGTLATGCLCLGMLNPGEFSLKGGTVRVGSLWIGEWPLHDPARFSQEAGDLDTDHVIVQMGYLTQTGGIHRVAEDLTIAGGRGNVQLAGEAALTVGGPLTVQGPLELGEQAQLSGRSAALARWGGVTQTGGTFRVVTDLAIGTEPGSLRSYYNISGGTLFADVLEVGPVADGILHITGPAARIEISRTLRFGPWPQLNVVPGGAVHMSAAAFENVSTDAEALVGLSNLTMIFEGGTGDGDPFEVAGADRGATMAGLAENFALGTLRLGGNAGVGQVRLADAFDNQLDGAGNEVLYVHRLRVGAGSTLDLAGKQLYYLSAAIDPAATITPAGGSMTPIAIPGTGAEVQGVPTGYTVDVAISQDSAVDRGTLGMIGGWPGQPSEALSCTFSIDPGQLDDALAASGDGYLTLIMSYDEDELALLNLDEPTLRPYWWAGDEWILGGTTPAGEVGSSLFAGVESDPGDYGLGYCGLNTAGNYMWVNLNHASEYGAGGGVVPEPASLVLLAGGALAAVGRRRRRA